MTQDGFTTGRLIGIEQSPEMLAQAHALVQRRGWTNVELVCASAEALPLTYPSAPSFSSISPRTVGRR